MTSKKAFIEMDENINMLEVCIKQISVVLDDQAKLYFEETPEEYLKFYHDSANSRNTLALTLLLDARNEIEKLSKLYNSISKDSFKNEDQEVIND
ncbi:MAG: hypothetical protein PHD70_13635 [Anaerostipes sp.]|nr:hypothetical protein [Anaerostipes sp.]MDD3747497.1 hypothetical protein [Anaerostipes sp.]MDD4371278.1 hypothetical protein [Anaerostipes sp.]